MRPQARAITTSLGLVLLVLTPAHAFVRQIQMDGQPLTINSIATNTWIAKSVVPPGRDSSRQLECPEVKKLAQEFLLFQETATNPQLGFLGGDISYWCEQSVGERRLRLEFAARRLVLEAADKQKVRIRDQGKLSWAAQQVIPDIIDEQQRMRR